MNLPVKVLVAIVVLVAVAGTGLWVQRSSSSVKAVKLTPRDMQLVFREMLPPAKQQEIAANPEERKRMAGEVKKMLALAQVAEQEGYLQRPEVASQVAFQSEMALYRSYRKSHPELKVTDEEINAYHSANPKDFDSFLQGNPRMQQQAQGPQRDEIKKQYGEFKVVAERARGERMDQQELTRLQVLFDRSQALASAYMTDLQKNSDKLVSDTDVDQYFAEHSTEFDEVRVRHILISTDQPDVPADAQAKDKKKATKALTRDEAKAKAQALLERVRKGEDFATLARENTDDPGSKDKGGEYDFFSKGTMVPEFEEAAFTLKPGEVSDLVETQFGFHIIKVEERRSGKSASDQKIRQQIIDKLKAQKIEARIDEIAAASDVEVPEDFDTTVVSGQ